MSDRWMVWGHFYSNTHNHGACLGPRLSPAFSIVFLILAFTTSVSAAAQSPRTQGVASGPTKMQYPAKLEPRRAVERKLAGGQADEFTIDVQAGQFLRVVAEQKGIDVVVSIIDPDGKTLVAADRSNGSFGPEAASIIANIDGTYHVRVAAVEMTPPAATYVLNVTDLRPVTPQDSTRISAERELFEAAVALHGDLTSKKRAITLLHTSANLWQLLRDRREEETCLHLLGYTHYWLSESQMALEYLEQALAISREIRDRVGEGTNLNYIGLVYWALGDYRKALEYYDLALPIERETGNRRMEGTTLSNIGLVYYYLGKSHKALSYYHKALLIERAVGDRIMEIKTLSNIGWAYSALNDKKKALEYYHQVLPLARGAQDQFDEGRTLSYIGQIYSDLGETEKALEYYQQALPIEREMGDQFGEAKTLGRLMYVLEQARNFPLAIFFGKQAVNSYQQLRRNIQDLQKEVQSSYLGIIVSTYRQLADLLLVEGRLPEAEQVLGMLKEQEFKEFTRGAAATPGSGHVAPLTTNEQHAESILVQALEWQGLRRNANRTAEQQSRYKELSAALDINNTAMSGYWQALQAVLPARHARQPKPEASAAQELLKGLPAGTLVIYTLVLDDKLELIVVRPEIMVHKTVALKREELVAIVRQFREAISRREQGEALLVPARKLYDALVAPIAAELDALQAKIGREKEITIAWSLDGILRYVPINALYDGRRFLIERFTNVIFTPANTNHLQERPNIAAWKALALGVSKQYESNLNLLPTVPDELRKIVRDQQDGESHGPLPGRILLDDSFTEQEMERQLEQEYPLVHIASHFVLQPDSSKSYLLLGGEEQGGKGYQLRLSEIQTRQNLSFSGAELLALSACETGLSNSTDDGKEVDSLAEIGRSRGARAVLATLWSIDDASTGSLMADFYQRWTSTPGLAKAEALRQAQLALLNSGRAPNKGTSAERGFNPDGNMQSDQHGKGSKSYSHPYYWAPFVLMGNWQ